MRTRVPTVISGWVLPVLAGLAVACGGESVTRPGQGTEVPERIIAIAPGVTEMLFELGLGDRVVGVGDYARWPQEVRTRPRIGGLFDTRLETIAGLSADLAVLLPSEEELRDDLEAMGVEVLTVPSETIADVEEMAQLIGRRCGAVAASEAFLERWHRELSPQTPTDSASRVLLTVTREPGRLADVLVSGPDTFLDELIRRLGAVNVMADAPMAYPQVGLEEIIIRDPQVVIELQAAPGMSETLYQDWQRLASEAPLTDVCVRVVAGDYVLIPGPRLPRLYRELAKALLECRVEP